MEGSIQSGTTATKADHVLETQVDGATMLLSTTTGNYVGFNTTSSAIWSLIDGQRDVSAIIDELSTQFEVERDQCASEVQVFMQKLIDEDLVSVAS